VVGIIFLTGCEDPYSTENNGNPPVPIDSGKIFNIESDIVYVSGNTFYRYHASDDTSSVLFVAGHRSCPIEWGDHGNSVYFLATHALREYAIADSSLRNLVAGEWDYFKVSPNGKYVLLQQRSKYPYPLTLFNLQDSVKIPLIEFLIHTLGDSSQFELIPQPAQFSWEDDAHFTLLCTLKKHVTPDSVVENKSFYILKLQDNEITLVKLSLLSNHVVAVSNNGKLRLLYMNSSYFVLINSATHDSTTLDFVFFDLDLAGFSPLQNWIWIRYFEHPLFSIWWPARYYLYNIRTGQHSRAIPGVKITEIISFSPSENQITSASKINDDFEICVRDFSVDRAMRITEKTHPFEWPVFQSE